VFDARSGERKIQEDLEMGRMGESFLLRWTPDSSRVWTGFTGGMLSKHLFEPETRRSSSFSFDGRPPKFDAGECAYFAMFGVSCADATNGQPRWRHVNTRRIDALRCLDAGWFDGDVEHLDDFRIKSSRCDDTEWTPLLLHAVALFDPKRVRFAAEGVKVSPRLQLRR